MTDESRISFGFWIYLMSDLVLFASLFAVYAVLQANAFGGPSGKDIFNLPFVLVETMLLLSSSFAASLSLLAARDEKKQAVLWWLVVAWALGSAFVGMEWFEFSRLFAAGDGWQRSGFLSSYLTLIGAHGLHVLVGLLWVVALIMAILRRGLTQTNTRKLLLWSLFWHFLDIIWIFIFSIVYLLGIL